LPSPVWLVPVLVILVGGWLTVRAARERGPTVTITFATAEGLEANKTTVRYKGIAVGNVKAVALRDDRPGVVATVELSRQMNPLLVEDARFWVVRPRVSAAGISGMTTLFGGAQIAFDRGSSSKKCRAFAGLDTEPSTYSDRRGTRINLRSDNPGSLDVGSPVYLRGVQVGRVTRVALDRAGRRPCSRPSSTRRTTPGSMRARASGTRAAWMSRWVCGAFAWTRNPWR
jgi:paraquat-inducible protein B